MYTVTHQYKHFKKVFFLFSIYLFIIQIYMRYPYFIIIGASQAQKTYLVIFSIFAQYFLNISPLMNNVISTYEEIRIFNFLSFEEKMEY